MGNGGKILLNAILILCNSFLGLATGREAMHFENLSVDDGLSQLSVIAVFQDRSGYMWFGTRYGLNRYDGRNFDVFVSDPEDPQSISDNIVSCIAEDRRGNIWVGTTNGLNRYDKVSRVFSQFFISGRPAYDNSEYIRAITIDQQRGDIYFGGVYGLYLIRESSGKPVPVEGIRERIDGLCDTGEALWICTPTYIHVLDKSGGEVKRLEYEGGGALDGGDGKTSVFLDKRGRVWMDDKNGGVVCYDTRTLSVLFRVEVPHEIRCISEDADGRMIIGTRNGLYLYDTGSNILSAYDQFCNAQPDLCFSPIEDLYLDGGGTLWVGTYASGVFLSNFLGQRFVLRRPWKLPEEAQISLGNIVQDGNNLWIGTNGAGLLKYNINTGSFKRIVTSGVSGVDNADNNVKCLFLEGDRLYLGLYSGKLIEFDIKTESVRRSLVLDDKRPICAMSRYNNTSILLGTYSRPALKLLDTRTMTVSDFPVHESGRDDINHITALFHDGKNTYVGTKQDGLYVLHGKTWRHFRMDGSFGGYGRMISAIYKDSAGNILVGTSDEGLNVLFPENGHMRNIRFGDGLQDDKICSVFEDRSGTMWVATLSGISKLNDDYSVEYSLSRQSGMGIHEFSAQSFLVSEDGAVYLGGDNGLLSFRPESIYLNDRTPPVAIKNVWVKDKLALIDLDNAPVLNVKYNEAYIRIECNVLNYLYPKQNRLYVMLEGAEKEWKDLGSSTTVNYVNLSPGRYVFRVKGSNNDGYWNDEGAALPIRVFPPFYLSGAAFIIYLLLLGTLLAFLIVFLRTRMNLARQIILKKHDEEIFQSRIDFFTNISHEFRTPLTLIRGPIDEVIHSGDTSRMGLPDFKMVQGNVDRMLSLLEQLMTFRKIEYGNMKLRVSRGDFVLFAKQIVSMFETSSRLKSIRYSFLNDGVPDNLWYDSSLMERVMMNLLSNAFKYTAEGGQVSLRLGTVLRNELRRIIPEGFSGVHAAEAARYLRFDVFNTGERLAQEELQRIFNPFVQGSKSVGGTGIGLSLSKSIVEMHHGVIWAESVNDGNCFSVILPDGRGHFSAEEVFSAGFPSDELIISDNGKPIILIVEDNRELREYVAGRLKGRYRIIEASDGKDGVSLARTTMPSLILSDIMMPELDGLQLCRTIKNNPDTAHIPVILLTARANPAQIKEGLDAGADDYIVKPFSMEDLLAKVTNILRSRENLKNLYAKGLSLENMGIEITTSDEKFLQKLNNVVSKNISNPQLNITEFCNLLGMSRSNLFRKIKETTGISPSTYIINVRLHLASKMLSETDLSITEIMYAVGFSNPSHFSTAFRKKYGKTPREFRKDTASRGLSKNPGYEP